MPEPVKVWPKGNAVTVQEKTRVYTFPGGDKVTLTNVTELIVHESGTHRIKADGGLHIIPKSWIHVQIDAEEWAL